MTDFAPIIDVAQEAVDVSVLNLGDFDGESSPALAVLPAGRQIVDLSKYFDALRDDPRWIVANAEMTTLSSFASYINRFKRPETVIFVDANPASPSLRAIIDFHRRVRTDESDRVAGVDEPRHGRHTVAYRFPLSEQIKAWAEVSEQPMGHEEMASFLADRQYDIINPPLDWGAVPDDMLTPILQLFNLRNDIGAIDDQAAEPAHDDERHIPRSALYKLCQIRFGSAARLMQLARTVEVNVSAKTIEGYNPKTGERTVSFAEEHETTSRGAKVNVPDAFLLHVPLFEGEDPALVPVRLQYRKVAGRLQWYFTVVSWRRAIRYAVDRAAQHVWEMIDFPLPVLYGQPRHWP